MDGWMGDWLQSLASSVVCCLITDTCFALFDPPVTPFITSKGFLASECRSSVPLTFTCVIGNANMVDTMRLKGAVSSTRVLCNKVFLGRQVSIRSGQSFAQVSSDLGVSVPHEARASTQEERGIKWQQACHWSTSAWVSDSPPSLTCMTLGKPPSLCDLWFHYLQNKKKPLTTPSQGY